MIKSCPKPLEINMNLIGVALQKIHWERTSRSFLFRVLQSSNSISLQLLWNGKKTSNFCVVELVRILVSRCGSSEIISIKRIESSFSASETKHQPKNGLNMFIWIDESSILFNGFGRVLHLIFELLVTFSCKRQHLNELEKVTRGRNLRMF